jgi:Ca2+:H+ antiporter
VDDDHPRLRDPRDGGVVGSKPDTLPVILIGIVLIAAVLTAVHHAEVVAHRVGEPFGSLLPAVAVTVIEVSLIVTLMISGGDDTATLARDTVFAAVMITCNGILGLSLLVAALRGHVAHFSASARRPRWPRWRRWPR